MTGRLLDVEATRQYLGDISDATLRRFVSRGHLCPVRLPSVRREGESGRRLLFHVKDLDAFIEKCKRESSAAPNAGLSRAALKGWKSSPVRPRKGTAA